MSTGLARLLDCDPIAAYWVGFLMADGGFTEWRMRLAVAAKDEGHLRRLADWLGPEIHVRHQRQGAVASLSRQDRIVVPMVRERFDIRPRKTYNPPSRLPYEDGLLLRCWLVGFIDGDGEVRRQTSRKAAMLHTVSHITWEPLLLQISERLDFGIIRRRTVRGREYVALRSHRHAEVVELLRFAHHHHLPVLERKWSKVDMAYVTREPTGSVALISRLLLEGWRGVDIQREHGYSAQYISNIRRRKLRLPRKGEHL